MKTTGIYKIESIINPNKIYIGSGVYVERRWKEHLKDLRNSKHKNNKIQSHYNKYGESDLVFSIVLVCEKQDLVPVNGVVLIEQAYIDVYNPWFNICKIAGNSLGTRRTAESLVKMSGKNHPMFGKHHSEETKFKMRNTKANWTEEEKAEMYKSRSGENHVNYGKKLPRELVDRQRKARDGYHHSEETKKKLSKKRMGKIPWNKGISNSEETRMKIKEALRKRREGLSDRLGDK